MLDRSQRAFATPHAGIAPLATTATSGGALSFTSLDHLGLTTHPRVIAAVAALLGAEVDASEPIVISAFRLAHRTEAVLAQLLGFPHVVLQRSGARTLALLLSELVGVGDHVLVDAAADRRVVEAVAGTSAGVTRFGSTDPEGLLTTLENVRKTHAEAGILVVTQSHFPVDGETPDLGLLRALGEHFEATLLVDATHDFGCVGPRGAGFLGVQDVLGYVDLVTADLGRTFGSEAGFVATRSCALEHRLARAGSTPLPTVRAAELLAALELSGSDVGDALRARIDKTATTLRRELAARGFHVFGQAGPIVPGADRGFGRRRRRAAIPRRRRHRRRSRDAARSTEERAPPVPRHGAPPRGSRAHGRRRARDGLRGGARDPRPRERSARRETQLEPRGSVDAVRADAAAERRDRGVRGEEPEVTAIPSVGSAL